MSIDRRLRQTFHRTAPAVSPNAWDGLSGVLVRRRRRRQIQLIAFAAAAIVLAIAAVAGPDVWDAIRADSSYPPAERLSHVPKALLGAYTISLSVKSPTALRYGLVGKWTLRLLPDGALRIVGSEHPSVSDPNAPSFRHRAAGSYAVSDTRVSGHLVEDGGRVTGTEGFEVVTDERPERRLVFAFPSLATDLIEVIEEVSGRR